MALYREGHHLVLASYGYADRGPYLRFNDIEEKIQLDYPVFGATFSLKALPQRFCVGRFDLATFQSSVCPLEIELTPAEKEEMCPACREATGFNPSFYFADTVSPQQREYNKTPHFAYLAYFSPQHVKAGISSETRSIERLLEQGARSACIVGRFENADDARVLEAALCSQEGILETMRASLKLRLMAEVRYSPEEAAAVLSGEIARLSSIPEVVDAGFAPEEIQDLSPYYFGGPSPDVSEIQIPEGREDECAGVCAGMVGGVMLMRQDAFCYAVPFKAWESHVVELRLDEVAFAYDSAPQQVSLF